MKPTKSLPAPCQEIPRHQRQWLRRLAFAVLAIMAGGLAGHGWILQCAAEVLIVDEHPSSATGVVILEEGDRRFDVAEELHRGGAKGILLVRRRSNRLERLGILPLADEKARRELLKRQVPLDDVEFLTEVPNGRSKIVAILSAWLKDHPDQTIDLLCDRFTSRTWKVLLSRADEPRLTKRIHVVPLPQRRYDETNWWRSKPGTLALVNGYLTLGFHVLRCGDEPDVDERTDADFRAAFTRESSE